MATFTGPLYVATGNPHKAREVTEILAPLRIQVHVPEDLPHVEETGATFRDNALLKAASAAAFLNAPALADDSGLVVDVLGGDPGVRSARYAGEDGDDEANNRLLIERLTALGATDPTARFVCCVILAAPDGSVIAEAEGQVEGVIRWPAKGEGGFGYDPLFFHPPCGVRLSELSADEKNALSHRGNALRALVERLR